MSSMLSAVSSAPYSLGLDAWALQTNSSEKATAQDTAGSEPEETKRLTVEEVLQGTIPPGSYTGNLQRHVLL